MTQPNLDAYWMPFTANRQFKKAPRLLNKSQGMHYWDVQGRQILDAVRAADGFIAERAPIGEGDDAPDCPDSHGNPAGPQQ